MPAGEYGGRAAQAEKKRRDTMSDRLEFQGKLGWILEDARKNDNRIRKEEVEKYFEDDHLSDSQMELVYDYLLSQKVAVSGYERKHGSPAETEEGNKEKHYTPEEENYLKGYEKELKEYGESADVSASYLPEVLKIAEKLHDGSVFLGDLVQEGNVSLMLALRETQDREKILRTVENGIEAFLAEQKDVRVRDKKMVEKVDELDGQIKKLKEEMGRKITLEELALYTDKSEAEIQSVLRLSGEEIKDEE